MLDKISKELLKKISGLHEIPNGAVSFRKNGKSELMASSNTIKIEKKKDGSGIDVFVSKECQGDACHIPVVVSEGGFYDEVLNDFYIESGANVVIVAGCGIHSDGDATHNGIHSFYVGKNAKVEYVENHLALGKGKKKSLNPVAKIVVDEGGQMIMNTTQIGGVDCSNKKTEVVLKENAYLEVNEKILTDRFEIAKTDFKVTLLGQNSKCNIISKSVAKGESEQVFKSNLIGKNECVGRVECDAIILDNAVVVSQPKVTAKNKNASLNHEATVGRIAGEQLIKLMSLGLNEREAEDRIIQGFLK